MRIVTEIASLVRVVVIEPDDDAEQIVVRVAHLPTLNLPDYGLQIDPHALAALMGTRRMRAHPIGGCSDWLLVSPDGVGTAWWLNGSGPHRGVGAIVGWLMQPIDAADDAQAGTDDVADCLEIGELAEAPVEVHAA
jgi:hypothetical protein